METVSVIIPVMNSKRTHFAANAFAALTARLLAIALVVAPLALGLPGALVPAQAETFKLGTQESNHLIPAEPLDCPQPAITEEMLEQGIKTNCTAKFAIAPTGKSTVELLSSTGSSEVDELTLGTLRTWRFRPASLSGSPVASVRKIKVEFEVD
ncbi:energy transducer TonB [bacterium]|nr:energy transducer TonB [bacterium]